MARSRWAFRDGASSIELYQDYGGFPLVADDKLKQWAAMLEANTGVAKR